MILFFNTYRESKLVMDRRGFLGLSVAMATYGVTAMPAITRAQEMMAEDDHIYWRSTIDQYEVTDQYINLEAGYYGIMSKPVMDAFSKNNQYVNQNSSYYARELYYGDYDKIIKRLADKLNVGNDELVLTRNATEALQNLIAGYNKLEAGDSVIYADVDYDSMQSEMRFLKFYRGVDVININIPEPATYQNILDAYQNALDDNPRCKLLLLTHVSNRSGIIAPVKEITVMAKERGVDVILDAAHSFGQFDFDFNDLGVDFVGFNLHKWIGAPLGVGMMYINKDRIQDIDVFHGDDAQNTDINSRVHTGTMNFATVLTVNAALDFHESIGIENITRRLRYLRNVWVNGVLNNEKIEVLTPQDERMYAGITSFRIKGKTSLEENRELAKTLFDKYKIFTAAKTGLNNGSYIRVTPGLYNSQDDVAALAKALNEITS